MPGRLLQHGSKLGPPQHTPSPNTPPLRLPSPGGTTPPHALPPSPRAPGTPSPARKGPGPCRCLFSPLSRAGCPVILSVPELGPGAALASSSSPTPVHASPGWGVRRPRQARESWKAAGGLAHRSPLHASVAPGRAALGLSPSIRPRAPSLSWELPGDRRECLEAFGLLEHGAVETGGSWPGPDTGVRPRHCELGTPHWPGLSAWLLLGR